MGHARRAAPVRRRFALIVGAVAFVLAAAGAVQAWASDDSGRLSSLYTRSALEQRWPDAGAFPLVVPTTVPAGVDPGEEPGFLLWVGMVDPDERPARRTWISYYDASAFGVGAAVNVFQRPVGTMPEHPCGAVDRAHLTRRTSSAVLTICSDDLDRPAVRRYWQSVDLTSDLDQAAWIPD